MDKIINILEKCFIPPIAYEIQSETMTTTPARNIQRVVIKDKTGTDVPTDFEAGVDDGYTCVINKTKMNKHIFFKIGQKNKNVVFYSTTLNHRVHLWL